MIANDSGKSTGQLQTVELGIICGAIAGLIFIGIAIAMIVLKRKKKNEERPAQTTTCKKIKSYKC